MCHITSSLYFSLCRHTFLTVLSRIYLGVSGVAFYPLQLGDSITFSAKYLVYTGCYSSRSHFLMQPYWHVLCTHAHLYIHSMCLDSPQFQYFGLDYLKMNITRCSSGRPFLHQYQKAQRTPSFGWESALIFQMQSFGTGYKRNKYSLLPFCRKAVKKCILETPQTKNTIYVFVV